MKRIYTIIIPVHNSEATILNLLNSLKSLEITPSEIIVVDDASSDQTLNIIKKQEGINLLQLKKNVGPAIARNRGAEIAKSPWLLFIDSDCSLPTSSIENAFPDLEEEKNNIVGIMGVFLPTINKKSKISDYKNIQRHFEIKGMVNPPDVFSSSCFTISRDAFFQVGGFSETFGKIPTEDNEFYFRLIKNKYWIKYSTSFGFLHHKKMSIKTLFLDDFLRSKAIILNLFGYLGERRGTLQKKEKIKWILEIFFCLVFVINLLFLLIALFFDPFSKIISLLLWHFFTILILSLLNFNFLKFSNKVGGYKLFIIHFLLRIFEILTAVLGIISSIFEILLRWFKQKRKNTKIK